jgi:hypothetical protein
MKASQKTVLVLAILIIILVGIQYLRSSWGRSGVTTASPTASTTQQTVSQSQLDAFRAQALANAKPAATSTIQLLDKYRKQAQQKYASSTYNPSAVKPTNI